jgi:hypothetical protein
MLGALPTYAQAPLPADQQALLQRALDANRRVDTYQSFLVEGYSEESQSLTILDPNGTPLTSSTSTQVTYDLMAILRGANPNGFLAQVIRNDSVEGSTGSQYTIQGELRLVDGTLYGAGETVIGSAPYIFAPGFAEIPDPADAGDLNLFEPQPFAQLVNGLPQDNPLDDIATVGPLVASVTTETGVLNSAPVEIITATISAANLASFMALQGDTEANDPTLNVIFAAATPESQAVLTVYVDQGGNALQTEISLTLVVENADATQLAPPGEIPAGSTLSANFQMSQRRTYSQINTLEERVGAPTIG